MLSLSSSSIRNSSTTSWRTSCPPRDVKIEQKRVLKASRSKTRLTQIKSIIVFNLMTHKFHYQRPSSINPLNPSPLVSINISRRHTISNSFKRVSIISIKRFGLHPRRAIVVPAIVSPWPLSRKKWKVRDEKRKKEVFFGTIPCLLINSNERRWFEQGFHEWAFSSCYCASVNGRSGASVAGQGCSRFSFEKFTLRPPFALFPSRWIRLGSTSSTGQSVRIREIF